MPKIEFKNVSKSFALKGKLFQKTQLHAVSNVSLAIRQGYTLAVVGESGCGKTTLARLLMKLHQTTGGTIYINGKDIKNEKSREQLKKYRENVQMIFQDPFASLNPAHSIESILSRAITLHSKGLSAKQVQDKVTALLEQVGLTPADDFLPKHPAQLSGGQRQRIGIARALAVGPAVLVADEPTSMLDVSIGIEIMNLLLELSEKQHLTMLYITHNLASARYMADEIAVMYAGTCVEYGKVEEVIQSPFHPYTVLLLNSTPEPFREEKIEIYASEEGADLTSGKSQCMFCKRCPRAEKRCFNSQPPEFTFGSRRVKCFLYETPGKQLHPLVDVSIYNKGE